MKRFFKAHGFTAVVLVSVTAYHAFNWVEGRFLNPFEDWKLSQLDARTANKTISVQLPSRNTDSLNTGLAVQNVFQPKQLDVVRFVPVDPAAGAIAHAGYALRYLGGQLRNDILVAGSKPKETFFWRDEIWLQYPSAANALTKGLGTHVQKVVTALESQGVTVLVLPVPSHLSVQRKNWPGGLPNSAVWNPHRTKEKEDALAPYLALLSEAPDQMVNLLGAYRDYQTTHPNADLFGTFESHWSSLGIAVAAQATLEKLAARGWNVSPSTPVLESRAVAQYDHDFTNHLILPKFLTRRLARFQWEEELYRLEPSDRKGPGRIVLAGTSCGARHQNTRYGLGQVLADALGMPLVDYSKERYWIQGSFEKMKETGFKLRRGDLLVWELPIKSVVTENTRIALPEVEPLDSTAGVL